MPESLHSSYTKVKSANIQKPWTQLSRTGSLTSVGAHVEQLEVLRGVHTLGASRRAQGFPRTLRPVPARARGGICRFSKGSAPSPCAREAARRTARGSPRRRGPLLRLREDGPVAPGRTADLCVGCEIPLLLLLRAHRSGSPEYNLWAVRSLCCFCSAPTEAAPRNTIGRGCSVVWNECQFSAEGGLRLPSCARTASARTASARGKLAFPAGASKPVDVSRLSSVLFVALKFQEESQRSNC